MLANKKKNLNLALDFIRCYQKRFLFFSLFLWLAYFLAVNNSANQVFTLDDLNTQIKGLQSEVLISKARATELQSVERITMASQNLNLVQTSNVFYLTGNKDVVALR